jgi:hypothetical protein
MECIFNQAFDISERLAAASERRENRKRSGTRESVAQTVESRIDAIGRSMKTDQCCQMTPIHVMRRWVKKFIVDTQN